MKRFEKVQQIRNEIFGNKNYVSFSLINTEGKFDIDPTIIEEKLNEMKENVRVYNLFIEYEYQLDFINVYVNYQCEEDMSETVSIEEKNDELRVTLHSFNIDTCREDIKEFIMDGMTPQENMIGVLESRLKLLNEEVD